MSTKGDLLYLLENSKDDYLSGESVAQKLGVSRAAVWKAMQSLQKQGLAVESVTGLGYRLARQHDLLTEESVRMYMQDKGLPLKVFEESDSTNLQAKRWAIDGAPHGAMVLAAQQTMGRGRLGRSFESPEGGLYLSMVLRPAAGRAGPAVQITAAAAVAVYHAVKNLCGIELSIKWVNDLYLGDKKCCGILSEAGTGVESGDIEYIVVGIGVNYSTPPGAFPAETARIAGSLYPDGKGPVSRAQLAAEMHAQLLAEFAGLDSKTFLTEYRRRSLVLGRTVTVMADPPYEAQAVAIDEEARLVVRRKDGWSTALSYGEISIQL